MSDTRTFGGLGLGLTICPHLANALGGTISTKSLPDKGSSFRLDGQQVKNSSDVSVRSNS